MKYYTYIIYSKKIDRFYVGVSCNPERRLIFHNCGKSGSRKAFTKRAVDWKIVFLKGFEGKADVIQFEGTIKKRKSRGYIESLVKIDPP